MLVPTCESGRTLRYICRTVKTGDGCLDIKFGITILVTSYVIVPAGPH